MLLFREFFNCFRVIRKRFFEFGLDVGYLFRIFCNLIIDDGIIKDLIFLNFVCNLLEVLKIKRRCV